MSIGTGYANGQIGRAHNAPQDNRLTPGENDARRHKKIASWETTLSNMAEGSVVVGSREPVHGTPKWVTLKVVTGGFATGEYVASLTDEDWRTGGTRTNAAWLRGDGVQRLVDLLDSGRYRINVPEHGVFLVLAWLVRNGREAQAQELMNEVQPWMGTLRFYPDEANTPLVAGGGLVNVATVAQVQESLREAMRVSTQPGLRRVRLRYALAEALTVWLPMQHAFLHLFARTMDGAPLSAEQYRTNVGEREGEAAKNKSTTVKRGFVLPTNFPWPCQMYPNGWKREMEALLKDYDAAVRGAAEVYNPLNNNGYSVPVPGSASSRGRFAPAKQLICDRRHKKGTFAELVEAARAAVASAQPGSQLTGRMVGRVRAALAACHMSRSRGGLPGTPAFAQWWAPLAAAGRLAQAQTGKQQTAVIETLLARLENAAGGGGGRMNRDVGLPIDVLESVVLADIPRAEIIGGDETETVDAQGDAMMRATSWEMVAETDGSAAAATSSSRTSNTLKLKIPLGLRRKVLRARLATLTELVDAGLVQSSEQLATLVPPLTAAAAAMGTVEKAAAFGVGLSEQAVSQLRTLEFALRTAFASRRSLLLLNLESQVKYHELPWARALRDGTAAAPSVTDPSGSGQGLLSGALAALTSPFVTPREHNDNASGVQEVSSVAAARDTLELVVGICFTRWPETILPNKLLPALRTLAQSALIPMPQELALVDEVAADIFMGRFTQKYEHAAKHAAALLQDTPYARYYGLGGVYDMYTAGGQVDGPGGSTAGLLGDVCVGRADEAFRALSGRGGGGHGRGYSVAANGMVVEQEQIITSHSLAGVWQAIGFGPGGAAAGSVDAAACAELAFERVVQMLEQVGDSSVGTGGWRTRMQLCKRAAYGYRQALFFLSVAGGRDGEDKQRQLLQRFEAMLRASVLERIDHGMGSEKGLKLLAIRRQQLIEPLEKAIGTGREEVGFTENTVLAWLDSSARSDGHPLATLEIQNCIDGCTRDFRQKKAEEKRIKAEQSDAGAGSAMPMSTAGSGDSGGNFVVL